MLFPNVHKTFRSKVATKRKNNNCRTQYFILSALLHRKRYRSRCIPLALSFTGVGLFAQNFSLLQNSNGTEDFCPSYYFVSMAMHFVFGLCAHENVCTFRRNGEQKRTIHEHTVGNLWTANLIERIFVVCIYSVSKMCVYAANGAIEMGFKYKCSLLILINIR